MKNYLEIILFFLKENVVSGPPPGQYNGPNLISSGRPQPSPGPQMQGQRRVGGPGPQQGYNNQGAGYYQQGGQQQQNQGS